MGKAVVYLYLASFDLARVLEGSVLAKSGGEESRISFDTNKNICII